MGMHHRSRTSGRLHVWELAQPAGFHFRGEGRKDFRNVRAPGHLDGVDVRIHLYVQEMFVAVDALMRQTPLVDLLVRMVESVVQNLPIAERPVGRQLLGTHVPVDLKPGSCCNAERSDDRSRVPSSLQSR